MFLLQIMRGGQGANPGQRAWIHRLGDGLLSAQYRVWADAGDALSQRVERPWRGLGLPSALLATQVLLGSAAVCLGIAIRRFRWDD